MIGRRHMNHYTPSEKGTSEMLKTSQHCTECRSKNPAETYTVRASDVPIDETKTAELLAALEDVLNAGWRHDFDYETMDRRRDAHRNARGLLIRLSSAQRED
jgi:hypothetical protein